MINKFREFTSCPLMNMNHVYRYSGVKLVEEESLSTHIVEVQIMGYMIIDKLNSEFNENINYGLFLEKALHHDLEESLTGDVCRTLKYHNERVLHELQEVASETAVNIYGKYFNDSHRAYKLWDEAKKGKEGTIVKIADMLCVANKALREVVLLNNNYFLKVVFEVHNYLSQLESYIKDNSPFGEKSTKYILDLIEDAMEEVSRVWESRKDVAEDYRILDTTMLNN